MYSELVEKSVEPNFVLNPDDEGPSSVIWELYCKWYDMCMYFNPQKATMLGDYRYNHLLMDKSFAAFEYVEGQIGDMLTQLKQINTEKLSKADKLNYFYLQEALNCVLAEMQSFGCYEIPTSHLFGVHTNLSMLAQIHPFMTEKNVTDFLQRLQKFPQQIQQVIDAFRIGIEKKKTLPAHSIKAMITQCEELQTCDEKHALNSVADKIEALKVNSSKELMQILENEVCPAYKQFKDFLETEYKQHARQSDGICGWENGKESYAFAIKYYTSIPTMTAERVHEMGISEVERITNEMVAIQQKLEHKGTLKEFMLSLQADPQFYFQNGNELVDKYKAILEEANTKAPKFFGIWSTTPFDVEAVPSYAEKSAPPAYYRPAPEDRSRPGVFYANTYKIETRPSYIMESVALHEVIPGHHLQCSIAQEIKNVPRMRQQYQPFCTGYCEGWGLYTERLGIEMGFYTDIYQDFGRLTTEMMRAIRLVVDTGLHHYGWSRQRAIDYFTDRSAMGVTDVENEIDRYMVLPGQAVSYKVGELKLWELRKKAEDKLQDKFDLKKFHDTILGVGCIPLLLLEKVVDEWISLVLAE